jgi:ribosomal protein S18 acetylase RimI-like enzyme
VRQANIVFQPAQFSDVPALAALEIELFHTDRCSKRSLRHLIRHAHVIVARVSESSAIVGYAIVLERKNSVKMRIYSFGIVRGVQRQGVAGRMLEHIEHLAVASGHRILTLEVGDNNTAAVDFYKKHGFQQYGFRLGYYEDGGHAILMHKSLPKESPQ